MVSTSRARTSGLLVVVVLAMAAAAFGAYLGVHAVVRPPPSATTSPPPTPTALARAAGAPLVVALPTSTPARPAAVAAALAPRLADRALGPSVHARVVDLESGTVLLDRDGSSPTAPASTAKLLTAAAVLAVHRPTDRIVTSLMTDGAGTIVLVGGGDPTLSAAPAGTATLYDGAARLSDLAQRARDSKVPVRRIVVDDSAFAGPAVSPDWAAEDVPSSYGSAVTAVMVDGGRTRPGDEIRSAAPDLDAGRALARLIGRPNLSIVRGAVTDSDSRALGTVRSAPFSDLVGQMLRESDNVIAECLARQVALAKDLPATFVGAARAIRSVMTDLGVDPGGGLVDGSGLAPRDRVSPDVLVAVLRLTVTSAAPGLRALLSGLPVAGWSGSLSDRFVSGPSRDGAGVVRAKTGTLTGVSALAGLIHDRDGRLLGFSIVADRAPATEPAESALDAAAATLSDCGCR